MPLIKPGDGGGGRGGSKEGQAIWNKFLLLINILINVWTGLEQLERECTVLRQEESKVKRTNIKIISAVRCGSLGCGVAQ